MNMKRVFWAAAIVALLSVAIFVFLPAGPPADSAVLTQPDLAGNEHVVDSAQPAVSDESATTTPLTSAATPSGNLNSDQEKTWRKADAGTVFAKFADWSDKYAAETDPAAKRGLEAAGLELAKERREAMKAMIQTDPEKALNLAAPAKIRMDLPESIAGLLEERISGEGNLNVLGVLPAPGKENEVAPVIRTAELNGVSYHAFVYGRRVDEPTRVNVPFHGVSVDNVLALSENAVRILEPEEALKQIQEAPKRERICGVSGNRTTINNNETVVDVGGKIIFLCNRLHVDILNKQIAAAGGKTTTTQASGEIAASSYTEGQKRLLLIRVDFPDLVGAPLTDVTGTNLINGVGSFYNEMSYSRASFAPAGQGSDLTPTYRMPHNSSYYGTNNYYDLLRADARSAAAAGGYPQANYDFDVTCIGSVTGFYWSGLGYVGAPGAWVSSAFSGPGVAAHELGHNFGLNHANFWDTSSQSITGPGTSMEYGDVYDTMGSASAGNNHFNSRYKNYLNWLHIDEISTYTTNGTYRIYAHDDPTATGIRGLKIVKDVNTNYWVELRQKFTGNKWLMNGAGLRWTMNSNQKSQLLDTTPGSYDGKNDASIPIGRTFADNDSGIYITTLGKGGTVPQSLDIVVYKGSFPTNLAPSVTVTPSATSVAANTVVSFSANASDPNGDALTYFWDFGDGNFTNGPTASKSWSTTGEYVVRCIVSDFRGGEASDSVIVTVGSPTTFRISGTVMNGATPVQGVRVYVSSSKMTYTDSDGTYNLVGLTAGSYTVAASLYPYTFVAGFVNPVTVGPSQSNINFNYTFVEPPPQITSQPQSQTVNGGGAANFAVGASGTNLRYQWRFNGGEINAATNSSYLVSNAQVANAGSYSAVVTNSGGSVTSSTAILTVTDLPSLAAIPNATVNELSTLAFTASASGNYPPFSYSLTSAPAGATIDSATGAFSWIPTEAQGAGTYSITAKATDSNVPAGSDSKTFTVTVKEVNSAPLLAPIANRTAKQQVALTFTITSSDTDLPANTKTYSLPVTASGATMGSSTGVFKWTPKKNQLGVFNFTARVADNGSPVLTDSKSFTITVTK